MCAHRIIRRSLLAAAGGALLSACAAGPAFKPPSAPPPARWGAQAEAAELRAMITTDDVEQQWWKRFNDPTLVALIDKARAANPDVRIAALRVGQSRAQRRAVAGQRAPNVSASGSYQRQRQSEFGVGVRLVDAIGAPAGREAIVEALSEPFDVYQAGFDVSWELDLWGRVRRAVESADAAAAASLEDLRAAQTSLTAEVARAYFQLRGAQEQLRIAQNDVAASESALELTQSRAAGGLITQLDVASRRARLAEARAREPQLRQAVAELQNALAALLGEPPGALDALLAAEQPPPQPPAHIAVGVASEVARRRPDIRSAEARLHAATAQIGVAAADLYPRITLTGGFLSQSLQAADFSEWGARQWSVGPSLYLPVFDGGRRRAVIELRELEQQEAAVNYQRTVLRAWREIDDALSGYLAERRRNAELALALAAAADAHGLAGARYEHGLTNFLVALDAQRTLLQAQIAYSDSNTALVVRLTALYKALGGGWDGAETVLSEAGPTN